jgi:radical SAM-linked protein
MTVPQPGQGVQVGPGGQPGPAGPGVARTGAGERAGAGELAGAGERAGTGERAGAGARQQRVPPGPPPRPAAQRLRVRFAKRGRLRFASHLDVARAIERAVRRAGLPVAYSAGFSPHPKLSYAGAVATCVASEAEYFEIALTMRCAPAEVAGRLDSALPPGLDVLDVTEAAGAMADEMQASVWQVALPGVADDVAAAACRAFLTADRVVVERVTAKGVRRLDARSAVVTLELGRRAVDSVTGGCAILRMVVRHMTPAVRPDDVLAALRQVAGLAPPSPALVTRLAQGPLDAVAGGFAEFGADERDSR